MKPTISIILPCYNVAKYITDCIQSICEAAKGYEEKIEVILIDDGSTDDLEQVLKGININININTIAYYYKYDNHGVSTARNRGIEKANGEYIWFVDPDDTITKGSIPTLLGITGGGKCDIIKFRINEIDGLNVNTSKKLIEDSKQQQQIDFQQISNQVLPQLIGYSQYNLNRLYKGKNISVREFFGGAVWHQLFRRDVIIRNSLKFNTKLQLNEDTMFTVRYLAYINKMVLTNAVCYNYNQRPEGALHKILFQDAHALVNNKKELALERERINNVFMERHKIDISPLYRGSLVLSGIEVAAKLSKASLKGADSFKEYMHLKPVQEAFCMVSIKNAPLKFKLPIFILKCRFYSLLYGLLWLANKIGIKVYVY